MGAEYRIRAVRLQRIVVGLPDDLVGLFHRRIARKVEAQAAATVGRGPEALGIGVELPEGALALHAHPIVQHPAVAGLGVHAHQIPGHPAVALRRHAQRKAHDGLQ